MSQKKGLWFRDKFPTSKWAEMVKLTRNQPVPVMGSNLNQNNSRYRQEYPNFSPFFFFIFRSVCFCGIAMRAMPLSVFIDLVAPTSLEKIAASHFFQLHRGISSILVPSLTITITKMEVQGTWVLSDV